MRQRPQQALLNATAEVAAVEDQQHLLLQRLQITALPSHETHLLPLDAINIAANASLLRSARGLVKSIERVGVLQPPSVVCLPKIAGEETRYEVIAGRRRLLAARICMLPVLKCEVYTHCTPQLASFLALIENAQRSGAWMKEVEDLRRLIDEQVGMTIDDLAACGFERNALSERLKIAQLPLPILNQIVAGKLSLETARKIAHLRESQQDTLADIARTETLTLDLVKQTLRQQVQSGLTPLQVTFTDLAAAWNPASDSPPSAAPLPASEETTLAHTLQSLQALTTSLAYQNLERTTRLLTETLIQKLTLAIREQEGEPLLVEASLVSL
ncbi:MAG: ParB/RepB/Spo0J family partition protein [Ktedonobacteraceae bacterium]